GICGTDLHCDVGVCGWRVPRIGVHDLAGYVSAVWPETLGDVQVRQRVAVSPNISCGSCFFCRRGQVNHCLRWNAIGVTRDGGFAEYVVAPEANVYPIGDLDYELAAFIEPLSCVVYGVKRLAI